MAQRISKFSDFHTLLPETLPGCLRRWVCKHHTNETSNQGCVLASPVSPLWEQAVSFLRLHCTREDPPVGSLGPPELSLEFQGIGAKCLLDISVGLFRQNSPYQLYLSFETSFSSDLFASAQGPTICPRPKFELWVTSASSPSLLSERCSVQCPPLFPIHVHITLVGILTHLYLDWAVASSLVPLPLVRPYSDLVKRSDTSSQLTTPTTPLARSKVLTIYSAVKPIVFPMAFFLANRV